MFLSVIVSCHNCKNYIKRVLNSLLIQNFDDFEIIISDDESTDDFMDVVNLYKSLLNIKYFKTEKHKIHCPGNTRRDGWKHATGDWVTFMDHDDAFMPGAFKLVYDTVNKAEIKYNFMYSPVSQVDANGNQVRLLDAVTWLHGNFYNRQWLINNNIDFKEDLFGNEDLYFNSMVQGVLIGESASYWKVNKPLYQWYSIPESLSNSVEKNTDCGYTERYFKDYLIAGSEPYMKMIERYPEKKDCYKKNIINLLVYSYFYYERAIFIFKDTKVLNEMLESIKDFFDYYKKNNLWGSTESLFTTLLTDAESYTTQRNTILSLSGKFIETHSFKEFLNIINNG